MVIHVQKRKIMKKTYIEPYMECVEIEPTRFLCDSFPVNVSNDPASGDAEAPGMLNDDEIFQLFLIH